MNTEKKLCLLVASLTLILVLLNAAPAVVSVSGVDGSLTTSQDTGFFLSGTIESFETTIDLAGTLGLNNWYTSDVTVTLTVTGTELEVATAYSYDNENWISYDGPFVESKEGYTTIYYNSTDSEGYAEVTKETTIQIDKTAPEISLDTERIPGDGVLVTITVIESYLTDIGYILDDGGIERYEPFLISTEGTHSVYYWAEDEAGNSISKLEYVEVVIGPETTPTEVSYTGDISGIYSDPITLEARLIDVLTGVPIPGKWIVFTFGVETVSAVTDSEGIAVSTLVVDQPAGIYDVIASFEGDEEYLASSVTHEFTIKKEQALAHYSGLTIIEATDSTFTLMATVLDEGDGFPGDLTYIFVTFTVYLPDDPSYPPYTTDPIMVRTTEAAGVGIATVDIPNLPVGDYLVVVSFNPDYNNHYESPDSEAVTLTIYEPKYGKTLGVGWVRDSDGNKGFFVFNVKYNHRGTLRGFVFYRLRVDNMVYYLRTTEITGFSIDGNHAFFEATATIYQYNPDTRERIQLDDSFRIRIDVWDIKGRCATDIFQIRIYDGNGIVVYEAGFDPENEMIWGKVMVKTSRRRRWY